MVCFYTQIALIFLKYGSIQDKYDKFPKGRTANSIFSLFFPESKKKCFWRALERNNSCSLMAISSCVISLHFDKYLLYGAASSAIWDPKDWGEKKSDY